MLNCQQEIALQHALDGHNLLIHGAAGTGKSFIIEKIVNNIRLTKKRIYVTATTGIACTLFKEAVTVHKWSGFGDGRFPKSEIRQVIDNNKQYVDVKRRILETDVLVIDEVSMLSRRLFECLDEICRLKNNKFPFGGIQIILAGDFRQLPPVPNTLYGDDGQFCFMSHLFDKAIPHRIILTEVIRQNDVNLINAIRECSLGDVSDETSDFIKRLERPLCDDAVKLFSTNEQVDEYNRMQILDFPGQLYQFTSTDSGEKSYLNKMIVPKLLWLKIGAPVILLRNLSDKLVNGLKGELSGITQDGPVIKFGDKEVPIPKVKCSVFSPTKRQDIAVRDQYPIKLAFAITIHKSQGMTLTSVEVNCKGMFKPGQLAVAMGRARNTAGLRVINYVPSVCLKQPVEVQQFLKEEDASQLYVPDRSCCRNSTTSFGKNIPAVG